MSSMSSIHSESSLPQISNETVAAKGPSEGEINVTSLAVQRSEPQYVTKRAEISPSSDSSFFKNTNFKEMVKTAKEAIKFKFDVAFRVIAGRMDIPYRDFRALGQEDKVVVLIHAKANDALQQGNSKAFKKVINDLVKNGPKERLAAVVKKLVDSNTLQKGSDIRLLLENLSDAIPELSKYFTIDKSATDPILSPHGVRVIVNNLEEKGSLEKGTCIVCDDYQQLREHLNNLPAGDFRFCFLLRNGQPNDGAIHMTPVFVDSSDNKLQVIVTDSLGLASQGMGPLLDTLQETIGAKSDKSPPATLIFYDQRRQFDDSNCPIFSIRDAVQGLKRTGEHDLFLFAAKHAKDGGYGLHLLNALPPEMMKGAQSFNKVIDPYVTNNPTLAAQQLKVKKNDDKAETLQQNVERHTREVETDNGLKRMNMYAADRFIKYANLILGQVLSDALSPETNV